MNNSEKEKRTAVALGDFDGMHRAHQLVITGASDVIIYSVNNRFSLMQKSVFEKRCPNVVFADFDEIKNMTGDDFIEKILIDKFHAGMILCGFNFRFGKKASWSALDMRKYLEDKDVWVRILEHLDFDGEPISSTRIRKALENGEIGRANEMLGYHFTFEAEVLQGDKRGRTIGFPTINQNYPDGLSQVKFGVYESRVFVDGREYKAFTNIGNRPTWRVKNTLCETHIFDFSGDLYGKVIRVELLRYLRGEKVFKNVEELEAQLINDKSSIV